MRKTVLLLASVALAMLLVSGVAWAANVIRCERGSTQNNPCDGTKNPDLIRGTIGRDYIVGWSVRGRFNVLDDHDTIYGYAKNDVIRGGYGRDRLYGGSGDDDIDSYKGRDKVRGGAGDDYLFAGGGRFGGDWMSGATGTDEVIGWTRNDTLYGGRGADRVYGGDGIDHLYGDDGPDTIDAADRGDGYFPEEVNYRDFVTCGNGFDQVWAETIDEIAADCEQIIYEIPETG